MTRKLALFDIDGTLANEKHRVQFAIDRKWATYFRPDLMMLDGVFVEGVEKVEQAQAEGRDIWYLTGRREDRYRVTVDWLSMAGFPAPDWVIMRTFQDRQILAEFKVEQIAEILDLNLYDDVVLYDDDPEVVRLVKKNFGDQAAVHCTWYIKPPQMVKAARG